MTSCAIKLSWPLLEAVCPRERVSDLLSQQQRWGKRERKLNQLVLVYLLISWHLFIGQPLRAVLERLCAPLRLLSDGLLPQLPSWAALCYRRKLLGVRLMRTLFRQTCRLLAGQETIRSSYSQLVKRALAHLYLVVKALSVSSTVF